MAWETVEHCCGHQVDHQLYGNRAWRERELCSNCKQAERDKENRAAAVANAEAGYPPLEGTEKQIAWAETIRHDMLAVAEAVDDAWSTVRAFHGDMPDREREKALAEWRRGPARYLVLTQSLGSHGLTLTEAAYAVFYADSFKYSERLQAEDRIHRIGQARRPTYISLRAEDCIDVRINRSLHEKGNALDDFQDEINRCREKGLREKILEMVRAL